MVSLGRAVAREPSGWNKEGLFPMSCVGVYMFIVASSDSGVHFFLHFFATFLFYFPPPFSSSQKVIVRPV